MDYEDTPYQCNSVKIMSHEAFAARHPYPPVPFEVDLTSRPIDRYDTPPIDRFDATSIDRHTPNPVDRYTVPQRRSQLPRIDVARLNALWDQHKQTLNPPTAVMKKPTDIIETMEIEKEKGRVLRKRKEKTPKIYKREANEKEISSFRKRVLRIPREKPFEEAYFTHRLWMFFRETKETEEDIRRMFNVVRDSLKKKTTLEKKEDPGKFTIPCSIKGIEFPHALCDTGSGVSILSKTMADHLGLKVEPSEETFIFVDCSQQTSGGIVRNLEVQIADTIIPTDFHILDVKLNIKTSLLLGRAFLATVGAVCDLKTNKLCLTLINPTTHYDPVQITKLPRKETPTLVATCFCSQEYDSMAEYETEPYVSTDEGNPASTDTEQPERTDAEIMASIDRLLAEADKEFPEGDFKTDSWHNDHYIPIMATDTTEEDYDEAYEEERAKEYRFLQDEERFHHKSFRQTTSTDISNPASIDTQPRSRKRSHGGSSSPNYIVLPYQPREDTRDGDYSIGSWASDYHESYAVEIAPLKQPAQPGEVPSTDTAQPTSIDMPQQQSTDTQAATSLDTTTPTSEVKTHKPVFGYLTPDEFGVYRDKEGHTRGLDGQIIHISPDDDIIQTYEGTAILPKEQPINKIPDFQRTSTDKDHPISNDIRQDFAIRRYQDGVTRFSWEQKDEYGVYRDEQGYARGINGEVIPVSKDDMKRLLNRASYFEWSHFCLPAHADHFNKEAHPEKLYTKTEVQHLINEAKSPYIWETQQFAHEKEKIRSSLQGEINWFQTANDLLHQQKDTLEGEVDKLRKKLESHQKVSTDTGHATSTDMPSSSPIDQHMKMTTYTKEEIHTMVNTACQDMRRGAEEDNKALKAKYKKLKGNFYSCKDHTTTLAKTMDHIINALQHTHQTMKSLCNSRKEITDEIIPPIDERLQEVEEELQALYTQKICEDNRRSTSTDAERRASIDISNPEYCTKAEMEKTVQDLFTVIQEVGDSAYASTEKLWFPVQSDIKCMEFTIENLQKEIKTISRQLAERPAPLESTDMLPGTSTDIPEPVSIDINIPRSIDKLLSRRKTYERLNDMQEELSDLSKHAYPTLRRHESSIEYYEASLNALHNEVATLKEKLTKGDEATRSFYTTWFGDKQDNDETCYPASFMNPPH